MHDLSQIAITLRLEGQRNHLRTVKGTAHLAFKPLGLRRAPVADVLEAVGLKTLSEALSSVERPILGGRVEGGLSTPMRKPAGGGSTTASIMARTNRASREGQTCGSGLCRAGIW